MSIDSTVTTIHKGVVTGMNPFRSRSTIVCILCLITLTGINLMAVKTGFFNEAFALVSVYIIKDILSAVFNHQNKSDQIKNDSSSNIEVKKTVP